MDLDQIYNLDGIKTETQIALANMLVAEMKMRTVPPHQDGPYREGIQAGLELAWRIITQTPDNNHVKWDGDYGLTSKYPTARLS